MRAASASGSSTNSKWWVVKNTAYADGDGFTAVNGGILGDDSCETVERPD
jgi:hypothetical protein